MRGQRELTASEDTRMMPSMDDCQGPLRYDSLACIPNVLREATASHAHARFRTVWPQTPPSRYSHSPPTATRLGDWRLRLLPAAQRSYTLGDLVHRLRRYHALQPACGTTVELLSARIHTRTACSAALSPLARPSAQPRVRASGRGGAPAASRLLVGCCPKARLGCKVFSVRRRARPGAQLASVNAAQTLARSDASASSACTLDTERHGLAAPACLGLPAGRGTSSTAKSRTKFMRTRMKPPSPPALGLNSSKYLSMGTASRISET
jgi:hypothetical protein